MQVFHFIKKQLNFSKKWVVTVNTENATTSSDTILARLMCKHGYKRKDVGEMMDKVKDEIMDELLNGNTVDVFGLVKIKADFGLRKKFAGSEEEIGHIMSKLSCRDIKTKLKANINQTFNHKYIKLFTDSRLRDNFMG